MSKDLENTIKEQIKEGKVFLRSIRDPHFLDESSILAETRMEKEIRKEIREVGMGTRTKEVSDRAGNYAMSTTMAGNNAMSFSHIGLGIVNPQPNDIIQVSNVDLVLGYGKRKNNNKVKPDSKLEKVKNLQNLKEFIADGRKGMISRFGDFEEVCNEVLINTKSKDVGFIFINLTTRVMHSDTSGNNPDYLKLLALYAQKKFKESTGIELPFLEYDPIEKKVSQVALSNKELPTLLDKSLLSLTTYKSLNLAFAFEEDIKKNSKLFKKMKDQITGYVQNNTNKDLVPHEIFSIAKAAKSFGGAELANDFISKNIKHILHENVIMSYVAKYQHNCGHHDGVTKHMGDAIEKIKECTGENFCESKKDVFVNGLLRASVRDLVRAKDDNMRTEILESLKTQLSKHNLNCEIKKELKPIIENEIKESPYFTKVLDAAIEHIEKIQLKSKNTVETVEKQGLKQNSETLLSKLLYFVKPSKISSREM